MGFRLINAHTNVIFVFYGFIYDFLEFPWVKSFKIFQAHRIPTLHIDTLLNIRHEDFQHQYKLNKINELVKNVNNLLKKTK